ncbi:hypothetical protein SAMN05660209_02447 [Geodermatophilus africanus]|uniref:Uncharacterized protein n=1 Tax=Geodermatophilus africanus TaxID=1137993 RepID=A0A1H3IB43_9ACTN|nr:hypothetical protein [Geodermatophilus africanus]SDY24134.1 hypothetical protein SAMN05660209_02447 [Geodermatophilus africanus]
MSEAPRTPSSPVTTELPVAAPADATPAGATPSGATPSGVTPSGATSAGAAPSGGAPSGPVPSGGAPSGPAPTGPAPSGPEPSGPVAPAPTATGPIPVGTPPPQPTPAPAQEGAQPTVPVARRPRIGARNPFPLTRMGPWAPVAGAVIGLLAGLAVALLLGGVAEAFQERLALVFLTVGLGMLGASGALLADEVRLVRRGAREAGIRPAWVEATANLINGLTPARLLLLASAFVLFLAAYVSN